MDLVSILGLIDLFIHSYKFYIDNPSKGTFFSNISYIIIPTL